jgi:membrane-associated phospholipid phosphatase
MYLSTGGKMQVHSPNSLQLFQPHALRKTARIISALATLALFSACAVDKADPTGLSVGSAISTNGVPFSVGLASPAWQTRSVALANPLGPIPSGHAIPQVAVAQYLALQQAEAAIGDAGGRELLETDRGAVAGASVVVLSALFPAQAQSFEDIVTAQANAGPGQPHPAFRAAEAIGRAVGAQIITRMHADGFTNPNTAVPPVGPGYWTSSTVPPSAVAGGALPGVTRWFPLAFAGQFRPVAPPAFGSAEFNIALAEIRGLSDTRTQAQIDLAALWAPRAAGYWVGVATEQIAQRGLSERDATHLYALLTTAVADAMISCWDAKLAYWFIRPWNADPLITTTAAVGKPNHPSYPSGHSCVSASAAGVLTSFFPDMGPFLASQVHDAGLSRMYGGIHFGFDIDAGQGIGHNVAAYAIAADASGHSVLTAH